MSVNDVASPILIDPGAVGDSRFAAAKAKLKAFTRQKPGDECGAGAGLLANWPRLALSAPLASGGQHWPKTGAIAGAKRMS